MVQCRHERLPGRKHRGYPDGAGKGVVAGLGGVDMVVRVDIATGCQVCDSRHDLVHVHVGGRAGAGLEDVDGELVVVQATSDLVCGQRNGLGEVGIQQGQFRVDPCGCGLDPGKGVDDRQGHAHSGDREVLDCPRRLGAPQGSARHRHLTHRVVLDPPASAIAHGVIMA